MSKSLSLLALTILMVASRSSAMADDSDLFSDVRTDSVFSSPSTGGSNSGGGSSSRKRITKAAELRDMLKSVGFEAKVVNNRIVSTQKELAPWTFPVMVELTEDETRVNIVLGLRSITDTSSELTADKLLQMMQASQQNAPALFTYNSGRQRTEVTSTLKNRGLTGETLRDEVNRLAIAAKTNETVWAAEEQPEQETQPENTQPQTTQPQNTPPQTTQPPQQNSPNPTARLVGRWSAARSATEAFAVEFKADLTFNLVYVNNGQQTKSSGNYRLENGSLTLTGTDGTQTQGSLTLDSNTQFTLTLPKTAALVFRKAS